MEEIHKPVLLEEVISYLKPESNGIYVDGNLGLGGHARAILEASCPNGRLVGFDLDQSALHIAQERLIEFGDRVIFVHRNFADIMEVLQELNIDKIDGLLLDLGLSSYQLDASQRGFSFLKAEPLDMRMDASQNLTAEKIINQASEEDLADIFFYYGEERQARRIASFIVKRRKEEEFKDTADLVAVIDKAVPKKFQPRRIHVATKVFQALRIAVNKELDNLQSVLSIAGKLLKKGGRVCVISFHSLEDRLVKRAFVADQHLEIITKKPVVPEEAELSDNPRSRSAKLRVAMAR